MPSINVHLNNGNWKIYSTIVDDWVSEELTYDQLCDRRIHRAITIAKQENVSLLTSKPMVNCISEEEWNNEYEDLYRITKFEEIHSED
jgi:hypothetical protein